MSVAEIKKELKSLLIGSRVVLKNIRQAKIKKVWIAKNCADSLKKDIEHYKGIMGFDFEVLGIGNDELGVICKKPFSVSTVGVLK